MERTFLVSYIGRKPDGKVDRGRVFITLSGLQKMDRETVEYIEKTVITGFSSVFVTGFTELEN